MSSDFKLYPHQKAMLKLLEDQQPVWPRWFHVASVPLITQRQSHIYREGTPQLVKYVDLVKEMGEDEVLNLSRKVMEEINERAERELLSSFYGIRIQVIETWASGYAWRYYRQPPVPPRSKRKGTRKQWKRSNPQGWRWRYGPVEPDHVIRTKDTLYCTERQYELIKKGFIPL